MENGRFEVLGEDPHKTGWWMVRHPHGGECNGRWQSREDAQRDCDRWNSRSSVNWVNQDPEGS